MRPFIGVDGEGRNLDNGYHAYFMLRAGDQVLWNRPTDSRLRTKDALEFLCGLDPNAIYVGYFFDYDSAKILEDLPWDKLDNLIHRERRARNKGGYFPVDWGGYQIEYFPRKELKVRKTLVAPTYAKKSDGSSYQATPGEYSPWITINDVGTFFQSAFITTIRNWNIGTPEQQDQIAEGKELRGDFAEISNEYIDRYNALECVLLADLMSQFRDVCIDLDIVPKKWQGPGQLAERVMEKHGIPPTKTLEIFSDSDESDILNRADGLDIRDPVNGVGAFGRYAYYGGWFETTVVGYTDAPCLQWDINSAYPRALLDVPCLVHGTWERRIGARNVSEDEISLCMGIFRYDGRGKKMVLGGFSVRRQDGSVHRPNNGIGWYWSFEIRAAKHQTFRAMDSWIYTRKCDCQPFAFVRDLYRERKSLGKNAKGLVLKLVLNSLYGKLVQSIGTPKYSNPIWASFITAWCRTAMATHIHSLPACQNPDPRIPCAGDVYMVATDAIVTKDYGEFIDEEFDVGPNLGQFSKEVHPDGLFIIQPGVYFDPVGDNDGTVYKTRGVPKKKVIAYRDEFLSRFDDLLRVSDVRAGDVHLPFTLFVGIKQALHRKNMSTLGQMIEYVDPESGQQGRRTSFEWRSKRRPQPIGFGGRRTNGMPRNIRTAPYFGYENDFGDDCDTGYLVQTIPYSKDIGGLARNELYREEFDGQPDWIAAS